MSSASLAHPYGASPETCATITALVEQVRPGWESGLVLVILRDLAPRMSTADLTLVAVRAAKNPDLPYPRAILWRGEHWSGLDAEPPTTTTPQTRCRTCGRPEHLCLTLRFGTDDDHPFDPTR